VPQSILGQSWSVPSPFAKYGMGMLAPRSSTVHSEHTMVAGPSRMDSISPFHPEHPMFAFGILAALAFGLMAASTTVRVGPAKGNLHVGNPTGGSVSLGKEK
jgi:hypothetical protein